MGLQRLKHAKDARLSFSPAMVVEYLLAFNNKSNVENTIWNGIYSAIVKVSPASKNCCLT